MGLVGTLALGAAAVATASPAVAEQGPITYKNWTGDRIYNGETRTFTAACPEASSAAHLHSAKVVGVPDGQVPQVEMSDTPGTLPGLDVIKISVTNPTPKGEPSKAFYVELHIACSSGPQDRPPVNMQRTVNVPGQTMSGGVGRLNTWITCPENFPVATNPDMNQYPDGVQMDATIFWNTEPDSAKFEFENSNWTPTRVTPTLVCNTN
ncbi:hypothetical protein [Streptomyces chryseus]